MIILGAQWLHNDEVSSISPGGEIINRPYRFSGSSEEVPFSTWNGFSLEGLPNRDSTKYREPYGLDRCDTILRGTFRYSGYCSVLRDLQALKLIDESESGLLKSCATWREFISKMVGCASSDLEATLGKMENANGEFLNVSKLTQLGILSDAKIENSISPLDSLATLLNGRMQYEADEKDAILMRHEVVTHQAEIFRFQSEIFQG